MKNKKAALFHFLILGVIAALAVFFIANKTGGITPEMKGEWQLDLLKLSLIGEEYLLQIEQEAKLTARQITGQLAEKGGWLNKPDCGKLEGYPLWNFKTKLCFPEAKKIFLARFKEEATTYDEIKLEGNYLIGKTKQKKSFDIYKSKEKSSFLKYEVSPNFKIDLGYDLEKEYQKLGEEALELVGKCREVKGLNDCLKEKKPKHWKFKNCEKEEYSEKERKVPFCAESPLQTKILSVKGLKAIKYNLALDFTPTKPFAVEKMEATFNSADKFFEIKFEKDDSAEKYRIYFTNNLGLINSKGLAEELKKEGVLLTTFFDYKELKKEEIIKGAEKCMAGDFEEAGKAYLCEDKITFILKDERLKEGNTYLVGITTINNGQESEINKFVKV